MFVMLIKNKSENSGVTCSQPSTSSTKNEVRFIGEIKPSLPKYEVVQQIELAADPVSFQAHRALRQNVRT